MRLIIPRQVWERLRAQAQKLSPDGKIVARALVRRTLDKLADDETQFTPLLRYPDREPSPPLATGPITVAYRTLRVVRNPSASRSARRLTRSALTVLDSDRKG